MRTVNNIAQYKNFRSNRKGFNDVYSRIKRLGKEPFVMPFWKDVNQKVLSSFQPAPKWDFLSNRAIIDTMFVAGDQNWLNTQVSYLEAMKGVKLSEIAKEDAPGKPVLLTSAKYKTSHNTLHHLYHMYFFLEKTGYAPEEIETVVEWGGGYGNFAKLWRRNINPTGTYVIIDTALFCAVQWLYLSTIFGKDSVHLIDSRKGTVVDGKINILPISIMDAIDVKGDLFVSTWGLSESLNAAQDYVIGRKWFGCKKLLIGFQDSTKDLKYASRLGALAKKDGAEIIDIDFIPNNHYAFK